jgi:hypothetical protein
MDQPAALRLFIHVIVLACAAHADTDRRQRNHGAVFPDAIKSAGRRRRGRAARLLLTFAAARRDIFRYSVPRTR